MIFVVTGLKLKSVWHVPRFAWHAVRSFNQAKRADGCLLADTRKVDGIHHTITSWRDGAAMKSYSSSGPHSKAVRVFPQISTGKVAVFEADQAPDWPEALTIWQRDARVVGV